MYLLTLCHCLQTRGGFLPSVFFFLIADVEAVFAFPHLPRTLPPSLKFSFALQTLNVYPIKSITYQNFLCGVLAQLCNTPKTVKKP